MCRGEDKQGLRYGLDGWLCFFRNGTAPDVGADVDVDVIEQFKTYSFACSFHPFCVVSPLLYKFQGKSQMLSLASYWLRGGK